MVIHLNNEEECSMCGAEGTYVLYDDDKMCLNCNYSPESATADEGAVRSQDDPWDNWRRHRRREYSGWYGEDRIKMVGGFASPWDFDNDLP